MKVAVIGAGSISTCHLSAYQQIPNVQVVAICDQNLELAKNRAKEYNIPHFCADYHEILDDPQVDAVSIVTPTFTHKMIVLDALEKGKHVFCEKPPALTYAEALACEEAAEKAGKVLMYGFVCRFIDSNQYVKQYIDAGKIGEIYYAEASRMENCSQIGGWFRDKTKAGGGSLMDAAIHQLDLMLYFMGYPKVLSVKGFTSDVNKDLPEKIQSAAASYKSVSNTYIPRSIESFASAYITFEGGKNLYIKAAHIANTVTPGTRMELLGDKGGINFDDGKVRMLTIDDTNYFVELEPKIHDDPDPFKPEIQHFVDCCNGKTECIPNSSEGSQIMKILNAIYESASTGMEIVF